MTDLLLRFLIGGVVVSVFSMLGDVVRPKSFAGVFGAAPSVALATLGLTVHKDGAAYAALESRSMVLGAAGFLAYTVLMAWVMRRWRPSAMVAAVALMPVWFGVSFGLYAVLR